MSVVIDQELISFKTKVEPSLGNMNNTKSLLVSKLTNLSNAAFNSALALSEAAHFSALAIA